MLVEKNVPLQSYNTFGISAKALSLVRLTSEADVKAMLSDPDITVAEVAKRMNVAPATLYRHLPGGRGGANG